MAALAASCGSNHHVSPWGQSKGPPLGAFVEAPDLDARLAEVDVEARDLGLTLDGELRADVRGARFVGRAYSGHDAVGRPTHATRIVTPFGVVLAAGPRASNDAFTRAATELVARVGDAKELRSLTDLTGAGALDVVLRADDGRLEIWRVESRGSLQIDVDMEVVPTAASDLDGDGRLDLGGSVLVREGEALRPDLADVATFDGTRFSNRTDAARAWHAGERVRREPKADAKKEERARAALEVAWHAILAGDDRDRALAELEKTKPPEALRGAFDAYAARIKRIER